MTETTARKLERAKVRLMTMEQTRFMAGFVLPVPIVLRADISTMATDGRSLFINEEFLQSLKTDENVACLCHEAMHLIEGHCDRTRIGSRDRKLWNIVGDLSINTRLLRGGCGSLPSGAIVASHDGVWTIPGTKKVISECHMKTLEELYHEILSENDGKTPEPSKPGKGEPGNTPAPLSDDVEPTDYTPEEREGLKDRLREAVNAAKLRGDGGGDMIAYYDRYLRGRVDWRNELRCLSAPLFRGVETFARPNRRSSLLPPGYFLPGRTREGVRVVFVVDTSGSIGENEIRYFLGEAVGLFKSYPAGAVELTIFFHDEKSYGPFVVKSPADLKKLKVVGGGGTDHRPVIAAVEKLNPAMVVFLTDACSVFPAHWKIPRALWLITERNAMERVTLPGRKMFVPLSDLKGGV